MKKSIYFATLTAIISLVPVVAFAANPATISISTNIPGAQNISAVGPCGWIVNFYTFAMIIAGILAFGAIVYGGFLNATSAGNASRQSEGRAWIWSALLGLLLLGGAYLIIYTVNPNLATCSLPSLSSINLGAGGGGGGTPPGGGGGGPPGTVAPGQGVSGNTNGLQANTVQDLNDLAANCNCNVAVTSGVTGSHAPGACSHSNGCKADIAPNGSLDNYITNLPRANPATRGDGAPLYQAPDGAIYADERVRPPNCGTPCNWTGAHWDMAASH